jgi:hypothetical protein
MIYKNKGEMKDPANYRGFSLLSTLSKIYTGRMNEWIEMRCIISEFRITFIRGVSESSRTVIVVTASVK